MLQDLVQLGTDQKYICWRAANKSDTPTTSTATTINTTATISTQQPSTLSSTNEPTTTTTNEPQSSDTEDDEIDEQQQQQIVDETNDISTNRSSIPLIDYILNVMKFVDAILSNNSTDDHCKEFVKQGGLKPLLSILSLPNLPVDCPITTAAQSVASVCKSILNLAHEPAVLQTGLEQLSSVVDKLKPLLGHLERNRGGSVLLTELSNCPSIENAFLNAAHTPLLHAMSSVHGYVVMLVHVCRTGQTDIRTLSLMKWGQDTQFGKHLLKKLVNLYTALVWESTLLLALCTDDIMPVGCNITQEEIEKIVPSDFKDVSEISWDKIIMDNRSVIVEQQTENHGRMITTPAQLKYIKALLGASSRLGRALAELFGLLVKLCVGSPIRQRRGQNFPPPPSHTSIQSKDIARVLSYILVDGLSFKTLPPSPIPKLKLTFLICSIGFTSPMLFDEKRYAYHLMLQKFYEEGGVTAFFNMFYWAMTANGIYSIETKFGENELPDGTGEFLDAWLMLLEKMVNPKMILESPHVIMIKSGERKTDNFCPKWYLFHVQRLAFSAIMHIWGSKPLKIYGARMSESILSILKSIFKGEELLQDEYKLQKKNFKDYRLKQGVITSTVTIMPARLEDASNGLNVKFREKYDQKYHLAKMLEMGFSLDRSEEALRITENYCDAANYIFTAYPTSHIVPSNRIVITTKGEFFLFFFFKYFHYSALKLFGLYIIRP